MLADVDVDEQIGAERAAQHMLRSTLGGFARRSGSQTHLLVDHRVVARELLRMPCRIR